MSEKNEVAVRAPIQNTTGGLILNTYDDMFRYASMVIKSRMAPASLETEAKVMVALQTGAEIGLKYQQSLKSICVINGNATIWGDAALGLCLRSGFCEDVIETNTGIIGQDYIATCEVRRKGREPLIRTFSWDQAKKANLTGKGPWKSYPERMMQMRARAFALRDGFPDVLMGMHIKEEIDESPENSAYANPDMPEVQTREEEQATLVESTVITPEETVVVNTEPEVTVASAFKGLFSTVKGLLPADIDDDMTKAVLMECAAFHGGGSSKEYTEKKELWTIEMMAELQESWAGELPMPVLDKFGLVSEVDGE